MPVTAFGTAMLQFIAGQGNGALMVNRGIVPGYCGLFVALRNDESQLLNRLVTGWPDRDLRVLDVGCGVGRHVAAMARLRPESKITGIERCDAMRAHCCAQFSNQQFLADIGQLAADETFDLMLLMGNGLGVLGGTAQDVRRGLEGLLAHLSDDGVLVIESTDHPGHPGHPGLPGHPGHPGFGVMPVVIAHGGLTDTYDWAYASADWIRNNIPPQWNLASSPSGMPGPRGSFHEIHRNRIGPRAPGGSDRPVLPAETAEDAGRFHRRVPGPDPSEGLENAWCSRWHGWHVLTSADAQMIDSELSIWAEKVFGLDRRLVDAFSGRVNQANDVGCLLPSAPLSALPQQAIPVVGQAPTAFTNFFSHFIGNIPRIRAARRFDNLVVALKDSGDPDLMVRTIDAVWRRHSAQVAGLTLHVCVHRRRQYRPAPHGLGTLLDMGNWQGHGDRYRRYGEALRLLGHARDQRAEIYWYPGGGQDLTPLLLLPDNSRFGREGYQPDATTRQPPLLLWITDPCPVEDLRIDRGDCAYVDLWRRLEAQCRIVGIEEFDLGAGSPAGRHYAVDAEIVRANAGTQRFRVLYSQANAELFPAFFAARNIQVGWVAFIRATGSMGGGPPAEWLMPLLSARFDLNQMPTALLGDQHFARTAADASPWSEDEWTIYERFGSRDPGWMTRPVAAGQRLNTGGVRGWGIPYHGPGHVALWVRQDRHADFWSEVQARR